MRPMQFPRRFPWLIALVLLPFSGVLFLPLGLWYWLAWVISLLGLCRQQSHNRRIPW